MKFFCRDENGVFTLLSWGNGRILPIVEWPGPLRPSLHNFWSLTPFSVELSRCYVGPIPYIALKVIVMGAGLDIMQYTISPEEVTAVLARIDDEMARMELELMQGDNG